jgi:hypothetical protein
MRVLHAKRTDGTGEITLTPPPRFAGGLSQFLDFSHVQPSQYSTLAFRVINRCGIVACYDPPKRAIKLIDIWLHDPHRYVMLGSVRVCPGVTQG